MPEPSDHVQWAERLYGEAEQLRRTMKLRWSAVAYFYSALHMVHTALPSMVNVPMAHKHPEAHLGPDGTLTIVRTHVSHLDTPYRSLMMTSMDVRYHGGDVDTALIDYLRWQDLPRIGSWVCNEYHGPACQGCWMGTL